MKLGLPSSEFSSTREQCFYYVIITTKTGWFKLVRWHVKHKPFSIKRLEIGVHQSLELARSDIPAGLQRNKAEDHERWAHMRVVETWL